MARLKLVLAFFALMILTAGVAGAAYYWKKYVKPEKEVAIVIEQKDERPEEKPDLGKKHYDRAIDFLKEGELLSARNELQYLLDIYPESPTMPEAKRALGEVNLDLLISKIPMEGKTEYKVKRGDAWITIARRSKTTIDYIMRANAKTTTFIYPNEDLTVIDLTDFGIEIELGRKSLTVKQGEKFIKEYPILDQHLPSSFPSSVSATISEKVAWYNGRPISFTDTNYFHSQKWIRTSRNGLFIRQHTEEDEVEESANRPYGVMVAGSDLEELFTIMRGGASVKVLPSS